MGLHLAGQMLLVWAFAANIVAGAGFFLAARGREQYLSFARLSYFVLTGVTVAASVLLYYLFFTHNFAFKYVFEYSDSQLSFFYLVSAFWGGQEGTYLLWLLMSVAFGFIILKVAGRYTYWAMAAYASVNLFFTVMLLKVSPFAFLGFYAADGAGLNPLLLDPWMVIHPPVMFVGYALTGVPFAIAIAALIMNDYTEWTRRAFPWVACTALFLAAGNILGGYWAYKTLGWGGFWAWDPVENSSLIPWFMSLALLHGLVLERHSGALRRSNLMLAAATFWLVVWGTFMTRSGVLSDFSVHSFVDLGQNTWLIFFLVLFGGITLAAFIPRAKSIESVPVNTNFFGREFSLLAAMILLFLFSLVVLFWSSLPILTKMVGAEPRAADLNTYNSFALPMGIIYALLLTLSPLLSYKPEAPANWLKTVIAGGLVALAVGILITAISPEADIVFAIVFALVVTGLIVAISKRDLLGRLMPGLVLFAVTVAICLLVGVTNWLFVLFFATAAAAIGSNGLAVIRLLPGQWRAAAAQTTHFGFGLMLLGILASSAFSTSDRVTLPQNQAAETYGLQVTYEGMANTIDTPHNELILKIGENGKVDEGRPELYFSERMEGFMKRPYIRRSFLYDLYFSPQDIKQEEAPDGLLIGRDQPASAGEYKFTFLGFNMGDHTAETAMKVTAEIAAEHTVHGHVDTLRPAVTMLTDEKGNASTMDLPAQFGHGEQTYFMSIKRIQADRGSVLVDIPGLLDAGAGGDRLLLDVSKKPLIVLVWIGTTIIMLGTLVAFVRRRKDAIE